MSKLYIGNLPIETNESTLRQLFLEHNLSCTNVLVKRGGYAFVDCPDQSSADKAIDKLNGKQFLNKQRPGENSAHQNWLLNWMVDKR